MIDLKRWLISVSWVRALCTLYTVCVFVVIFLPHIPKWFFYVPFVLILMALITSLMDEDLTQDGLYRLIQALILLSFGQAVLCMTEHIWKVT